MHVFHPKLGVVVAAVAVPHRHKLVTAAIHVQWQARRHVDQEHVPAASTLHDKLRIVIAAVAVPHRRELVVTAVDVQRQPRRHVDQVVHVWLSHALEFELGEVVTAVAEPSRHELVALAVDVQRQPRRHVDAVHHLLVCRRRSLAQMPHSGSGSRLVAPVAEHASGAAARTRVVAMDAPVLDAVHAAFAMTEHAILLLVARPGQVAAAMAAALSSVAAAARGWLGRRGRCEAADGHAGQRAHDLRRPGLG